MTTDSEDLLIEHCRYEQQLREWEDARADREDELEMRNFEISRLQSAAEPLLRSHLPQVSALSTKEANEHIFSLVFLFFFPGAPFPFLFFLFFFRRDALKEQFGKDQTRSDAWP